MLTGTGAHSGREGSRAAPRGESASSSGARVAGHTIESVGQRAMQSNLSASQRAAEAQRSMAARLERITAPLGAPGPPPANQDAIYLGEGMLNDLEELYQREKDKKT